MQAPYVLLSDATGMARDISKEWFLRSVEQTPTCWLWRGATTAAASYKNGHTRKIVYGQVQISRRANGRRQFTGAHRVAYQLWKGEMPRQAHVCHKCDNGLCVNPDHLFLGSWQENMRDMWAKGRHPGTDMAKRPNFNKALITERAMRRILALRAEGMPVKEIVHRVFYATVRSVVSHRGWKAAQQQTQHQQQE